MQFEFVGRNIDVDEGLKAQVTQKVSGANRFLSDPVEVRVVLEGGAGEKRRYSTELHVAHRGGVLHSRAESPDLSQAVADAAAAIVEQARRGRKKTVARRRRGGRLGAERRHWPIDVVSRTSVAAGRRPEIIRSGKIEIEPMSIDEAAQRLERSRNEFYVFLDSESKRVSVLYKRRDDQYGLIAPEP